jgi:hypothetical protein
MRGVWYARGVVCEGGLESRWLGFACRRLKACCRSLLTFGRRRLRGVWAWHRTGERLEHLCGPAPAARHGGRGGVHNPFVRLEAVKVSLSLRQKRGVAGMRGLMGRRRRLVACHFASVGRLPPQLPVPVPPAFRPQRRPSWRLLPDLLLWIPRDRHAARSSTQHTPPHVPCRCCMLRLVMPGDGVLSVRGWCWLAAVGHAWSMVGTGSGPVLPDGSAVPGSPVPPGCWLAGHHRRPVRGGAHLKAARAGYRWPHHQVIFQCRAGGGTSRQRLAMQR